MRAAGVPTAATLDLPHAPCVVKADGLAAGKGVSRSARRTRRPRPPGAGRASTGGRVVVEELLEGEEVSLFALCDGVEALALPAARDAKRLRDGDEGPNTGGMGAYSPVPFLTDAEAAELVEQIHRPVLEELARRGSPFVGLLYAGLMLTDDGPRVLEFNCRFGDPETQALLPRLEGDLLAALARGSVGRPSADAELATGGDAAVTVVLAAPGYPDAPESGIPLAGLDRARRPRARSSSTPARRFATARWSAPAAASSNVTAVAPSARRGPRASLRRPRTRSTCPEPSYDATSEPSQSMSQAESSPSLLRSRRGRASGLEALERRAARRDPDRLRVRPGADAAGDRRAERARDLERAPRALGAPESARGRRVRVDRGRARRPRDHRRGRDVGGASRARSRPTPTSR